MCRCELPTEARPIDEGVPLPSDTDNVTAARTRTEGGFPLAVGGPEPLTLVLEVPPPEFKGLGGGRDLYAAARGWYGDHAVRFVDALLAHAPGGFVDAVLGELLYRKSCIFRVTGGYPEKVETR